MIDQVGEKEEQEKEDRKKKTIEREKKKGEYDGWKEHVRPLPGRGRKNMVEGTLVVEN